MSATFLSGAEMRTEDVAFMMAEAEKIFGTEADPNQIAITQENLAKLLALHPSAYLALKTKEGIVGWTVVVPTQRDLARAFLEKKMTERELFERTQQRDMYDALYFSAVIVLPTFRRKGYATQLIHEVVRRIPHTKDALMAHWAYSGDGRELAASFGEQSTGQA